MIILDNLSNSELGFLFRAQAPHMQTILCAALHQPAVAVISSSGVKLSQAIGIECLFRLSSGRGLGIMSQWVVLLLASRPCAPSILIWATEYDLSRTMRSSRNRALRAPIFGVQFILCNRNTVQREHSSDY